MKLKLIASLATLIATVRVLFFSAALVLAVPAATPPTVAGSYSLAIIPDSQNYVWLRPELYTLQTGWLAANIRRYNIKYVLHVGDITQHNNREEWAAASRAHRILDGLVPLVYVPGNHDLGPDGEAESRTTLFNDFITLLAYRSQTGFGGVYDREPERTENSYHLFEASGRKWLILALEFAPRDDVLRWANEVVARYPSRSVILLTHAYLRADGTRFNRNVPVPVAERSARDLQHYGLSHQPGGFNDGEDVWRKLVSQHLNFALVICGHVGIAAHLASIGVHGNTVHQLVVDYQNVENGGNGWLRLLQFLPDGRTVRVRDYSPLLDQTSATPECAFDFTFDPPSIRLDQK